jgi:hypothetical protein
MIDPGKLPASFQREAPRRFFVSSLVGTSLKKLRSIW